MTELTDEQWATICEEVHELRMEHRPEWASEAMRAKGKEPIGCVVCYPADGSWPCSSRLSVDAISVVLDRANVQTDA